MAVAELNPSATAPAAASGEVVVSVRGLTKVFRDFWNRPRSESVV